MAEGDSFSTQRDSAGLVRGIGRVLRWRDCVRGLVLRRRRRRMAVRLIAAKLRKLRLSGVIVALGDDAVSVRILSLTR